MNGDSAHHISNGIHHVFHPVIALIISISCLTISFVLNTIGPVPDVPVEYIHWAQFVSAIIAILAGTLSVIGFFKKQRGK